jgi:RecA-family ATPase
MEETVVRAEGRFLPKENLPEEIAFKTNYSSNMLDMNDLIDHEAPPVDWLVKYFLPFDIIGLIPAAGGTGKTFILLDLALSVVTGTCFLKQEWATGTPGKVLCVFGEESRDEIHRRLKKMILKNGYDFHQCNLIKQNLRIELTHGSNPAFANSHADDSNSDFFNDLVADSINQRYKLIILDPLSRFYKADENDATQATLFIEKLEQLKERVKQGTGEKMVVLGAHHVNKSSTKTDMTSGMMRGSSAFVDGARWVLGLQKINAEDWCAIMGYSMAPKDKADSLIQARNDPERRLWVRMERVKANYIAPQTEEEFLKIDNTPLTGGTLSLSEPPRNTCFASKSRKNDCGSITNSMSGLD